MENKLAQNFTITSLLKFTAPTCIMLMFMSLYQMTDAVFVSNFVGENALSALNIVFPIPSIIIALSIMLATGGSAIIAKNMGEGQAQKAKQNFSMIVFVGFLLGIVIMIVGVIWIKPIIKVLGATPILYAYSYDYLFILLLACPLTVLQMLFQTFFVTAGKPHLGLVSTILGGLSNIVLDYLFIVVFHMGVAGAAVATSIGYALPAIIGLFYFFLNKKGTLYFVKPVFDRIVLLKTCTNGSSEMVTNLAIAIVTLLFNKIMLQYLGENGVAAITIVLYAQFLLTSIFMGFSNGVAPVFSYNYGNNNKAQMKKIFKMSLCIISVLSILMYIISLVFATPIISVFTSSESEVFKITYHGFFLFSISYLFTGVNIFASSMFTAFSNGKISALLSFLRTFVFLVAALLLLPEIMGVDGIWLAVPIAEFIAILVSIFTMYRNKEYFQS